MIVERFAAKEVTLDHFLDERRSSGASSAEAVSIFLYPFGERVSNALAAPLWGRRDVRFVVPKGLGILIKHSSSFDPFAYLLTVSENELQKCIGGADNPYVIALAYEMRRSFGYTKLKGALSSPLVLKESAKQASIRFYDVKGALRLPKWIKYGCVKVIRREVKSVEELHPLSIHLFRAQTFFR